MDDSHPVPVFDKPVTVAPIDMTSSCGSGLRISERFGNGAARSGRVESSAFGLPPGQPVIVCWSRLKIWILRS